MDGSLAQPLQMAFARNKEKIFIICHASSESLVSFPIKKNLERFGALFSIASHSNIQKPPG
jgi:hypothetical protein